MSVLLVTELNSDSAARSHPAEAAEGNYVLIMNDEIIGVFQSKADAIWQGYNQFGDVPIVV